MGKEKSKSPEHEKARSVEAVTSDAAVNLALDTLKLGKQALVFVNTKRGAERVAEDISKKVKETNAELQELSERALHVLSRPTKQCERLARCLKKGIAFHHAGLAQEQREIIEEAFRNNKVRIICCTPTLAAGVDLPAFRTIIRDLRRYSGRGMSWIPVLEYLQMAGRSGRPSFDNYGEAIAVASGSSEAEEIIENYLRGEPEPIYSKLAVEPVLRTYLLSLIASGFIPTTSDMADFFSRTYWAHQYGDVEGLRAKLAKTLEQLEEWGFATVAGSVKSDSGFVSADQLEGKAKVRATAIGRRVSELYLDPLTASQLIHRLQRAAAKRLEPFQLLHAVSFTLEMRPLLRVKQSELEWVEEQLALMEESLLEEPRMWDYDYDEFIRSVKTAMFLNEWIEERDEEFLLEKYGIRPGEIRAKVDIADWLLYACQEFSKMMSFRDVSNYISRLRLRLKYGAKEELIPLLKLRNIGRVRARKLYNNRIRDVRELKEASLTTLAQLIGRKTAIDVKSQLGQEVRDEEPKKKRKGQHTLGAY